MENQDGKRQEMKEQQVKAREQERGAGREAPWSRWKSRSGWTGSLHLKKDQLLIGLLTGVLLIVIALPVERGMGSRRGDGNSTGAGNSPEAGETSLTELSGWNGAGDSAGATDSAKAAGSAADGELAGDAYTRQMETRLAQALSQVEGVGRVQVLITWKSSGEKVVEKDTPGSSQLVTEEDSSGGKRTTRQESTEESTVYQEQENGSRSPYVIKEIQPQAEGVLVVAQGGGNPVIARNILEAVQALFPLDAHKIKIMKMEGSK